MSVVVTFSNIFSVDDGTIVGDDNLLFPVICLEYATFSAVVAAAAAAADVGCSVSTVCSLKSASK